MIDIPKLLATLAEAGVEFILVAGAAAVAHGSTRLTQDVDVVYARDPANLKRIVAALAAHHPYLRRAPPGLPFVFDEKTLKNGLNFPLSTDLGPVDLPAEIAGGGQIPITEAARHRAEGLRAQLLVPRPRKAHRDEARRRSTEGSRGNRGAGGHRRGA